VNRRILLNLAAFAVISGVIIVWSFVTLFEVDAIDDPDFVTVEFESSPGLSRGFEVAYLGHAIGSVDTVRLRDGYAEAVLRIDKGHEVPAQVDAAARRKSAIGEPFVDLSPTPGTDADDGPRLQDGDRIPLERTSSPISYGVLFKAVDALLAAIDPDEVGIVIHELAAALDGRGDDLRRVITGSRALTERTVANGDEIEQFLVDMGDITGVLAENRDALGQSIDAFAAVTEMLDDTSDEIERFLVDGPSALRLIARIVATTDAQLACTVDGLAVLGPITADGVAEALGATIRDSGAALEVTNGSIGEDGYLNLTLLLSDGRDAVIYPQRRPQPVAPQVAGCGELAGPTLATGEGGRASLGPGGRGVGTSDQGLDDGGRDGSGGVGRDGGSDLDSPEEPLLGRWLRAALPFLLLAALAGVAWWLWKRYRASREPGVGDGPAELDEDVDEPVA
jgi:phospholipid/cholesterol/gamma-HCH transport system substrate-binding protein